MAGVLWLMRNGQSCKHEGGHVKHYRFQGNTREAV